jgi:ABC-type hemin transport system ATPase subunit
MVVRGGGDVAIAVQAVCASRGKGDAARQVLRRVNLNVPRGTLHMLVGPNGCGKVCPALEGSSRLGTGLTCPADTSRPDLASACFFANKP